MLQRLSSTDTRCESNSRIKFARANLMLQWTPAVDTRCEGSVTPTENKEIMGWWPGLSPRQTTRPRAQGDHEY